MVSSATGGENSVVAFVAQLHPATISGALVSIALFLFLDAVWTANREQLVHDQFTFVMALPCIISSIGFAVVNVTKPGDFHDITTQAAKARGFLFLGWVLLFTSSIISLAQCSAYFVGMGTRESVFPGTALVVVTCVIPIAAVALWWSKGTVSASEEFEW
jgi:hypothetical protein